jgi:NAD(P)-dependent dehydrogenase (short-subunit alcohol dehydrogenase family)
MSLSGKTALVTGAAQGIGRDIALALAADGADVAICDVNLEAAQKTVADIEAKGSKSLAIKTNVAASVEVTAMIDQVVEKLGRIDILVNNAGIGAPSPAEKVLERDFDETLAVNLKGTFFTAQAVGKVMIRQGYGRIVNIGSQAGAVALPTESVYCMTKAAVAHLTKCLALEWARHGITVNAVAPTFIETPGTRKWLDDRAFRASVVKRIPLGRTGVPGDVAGPVVFLASRKASLITGATLLIDGGWTLA